jgi:Tfp pilus assembly protein PilF
MKKSCVFVFFTVLAFATLSIKPNFCQAANKEDLKMEKLREQVVEAAQKKDNDTAVKLGEEYLKSDPGNIEILVTLSGSYLTLGNIALAEEKVKKAIGIDVNNAWAIKTLAKVYKMQAEQATAAAEKKKLLNSAEAEIEKALKINSSDPWAQTEAALIYLAQGDKDAAKKAIKKAAASQPNDAYIQEVKAKIEAAL